MPEKCVTAADLIGLFAGVDDLVSQSVVEKVALRLCVYPFLAVGGGYLVELGALEGYGSVSIVVEDYVVNSRTKVLEPSFLCEIAETWS